MFEEMQLNVPLLRRRVPNLTVAARSVGLRPATVSDLCTGKIPLARAEVRTLVALANLAGCSLDELVLRGAGTAMIETGIKALDLFAPLVRGGTAGLVARQGLGQMVLQSEILRRLKQRGFATCAWIAAEPHPDLKPVIDEAEVTGTTTDDLLSQIAALRTERDVVVAADRATVLSGELFTLQGRLQESVGRPVTFTLVDAAGEAPDEDVPYGPLETLWRFDPELAYQGLFPAIDPVLSTSSLLEGLQLEESHLTVQQRARKLLRRHRELRALARVRGVEFVPANEKLLFHRGERLEAYLTQPIYVAEPFTKRHGEWVSLSETIEGVRRILDGAADELDVAALKYVGRLPQA